MKPVRTVEAIQAIREACQVAASVLARMVDAVEVGVNTYDLDQLGRKLIAEHGAESACFNYRHQSNVFPAYTCISVNEEIVHGIGRLQRVIAPGDLVSLDVVVRYRGMIGDNATTVGVAPVSKANQALLDTPANRSITPSVMRVPETVSEISPMPSNVSSSPTNTGLFAIL